MLHARLTPQLSLVLTVPTYEGMARLSWPGSLIKYQDGTDSNQTCEYHSFQYWPGLTKSKYVDGDQQLPPSHTTTS